MSKIHPSVTLLITTYNAPAFLRLTLLSVLHQTVMPNEIVIADDGSTEETRKLIEKMSENFPCPIIHSWQEDEGFQLSKSRNKAIAKASSDYIIQIDGDVIMEKHFVEDHLYSAKENHFTIASRMDMDEELTAKVLAEDNVKPPIWSSGMSKSHCAFSCKPLMYLFLRYYNPSDTYYARGANMSFWRKDAIEINGYDENFKSYGLEDNEFVVRMLFSGKTRRSLKYGGVQYHFYHGRNSGKMAQENHDIYNHAIDSKLTRCENGLDKYL